MAIDRSNETYGGAGDDGKGEAGSSVVQTRDGGYALTGYTNSFGAGSSDFYLVKLASSERPSKTWTVAPDGSGDFPTIQKAIDAASDGDTLFVRNGTHSGPIVIFKTLTLQGEDRNTTVIDGGSNEPSGSVVLVTANNVKISGFTIQHCREGGNAIWLYNYVNMTFSDNIITGNNEGIRILHSSGNIISYNTIQGCYYNTGLGFNWAYDNSVYGNIIANNNVGIGGNFWHNKFFNNTIRRFLT